jgi:DNA-binding transcriptional LysR family regulator
MFHRDLFALIPVFDAIFSERSLSGAAKRLGVTQPAVSQALARLRKLTNDELFTSTGRGVRPTPRALEMADHVQSAVAQVNAAFATNEVNIGKLERTFVLDIGGGYDALILPRLVEELTKEAPRLRILAYNDRAGDLLNELKYGETELAFDFQPSNTDEIRCELLASDAVVVVTRVSHPALTKGLTKSLYLGLPHATLVWSRSSAASAVTVELERLMLKPHVAVSVSTFMALGGVVASSNLIATTPAIVARMLGACLRIEQHSIPFRFPPLRLYQLWHARFDNDPAHRWLRAAVKKICEGPADAHPLKWVVPRRH